MTAARFSLRLDSELKNWLEEEARRQDRSAAWLAKKAIEALKRQSEAERRMIRDAVAEADEGVFVSQERVTEWFDSLGTEDELPAPEPDVFPDRS